MLDSRRDSNAGYGQAMGYQGQSNQMGSSNNMGAAPAGISGGMDTRPLGSGPASSGQNAASGLGGGNFDALDDDIPF